MRPSSIRFQATAHSAVDDLVVEGVTPTGDERHLAIAVRRSPKFRRSDADTTSLLQPFLRLVSSSRAEIESGGLRLGLAVASSSASSAREVAQLAAIARGSRRSEFRSDVQLRAKSLRNRLDHLDDMVAAASAGAGIEAETVDEPLTWQLLRGLWLIEVRVESPDESDRTTTVAWLQDITQERSASAADHLFGRLAELAGHYASHGAHIGEADLRRDLRGVMLLRSPSYPRGWRLLDTLAKALRDGTGLHLEAEGTRLEIDRRSARAELASAMEAVGRRSGALAVVGEPDVGKSALTIRACDQLVAAGGAAVALSAQDLPVGLAELQDRLDAPVGEILGATASGDVRLLVIDGAEAVLVDERERVVRSLAAEAFRNGLGVVAVTRTDAQGAVMQTLRAAREAAGVEAVVDSHEVGALAPEELEELVRAFPSLARLGDRPSGLSLLARPGLADLLLKAMPDLELPHGSLSEADLFAVVWHNVVLRGGRTSAGGVGPDAREGVLLDLARNQLDPAGGRALTAPEAMPSLRSDGVLLPLGAEGPWRRKDEFASDLWRDFAVARFLVVDGFGTLKGSSEPRWALRAARLACQARLLQDDDLPRAYDDLMTTFADVASRSGRRWGEVPVEAMLTLGSADQVLEACWPLLLRDDQEGVETLIRLALQRHVKAGIGDTLVLAPLVRLGYCGVEGSSGPAAVRDREGIERVVLAWLRGFIVRPAEAVGLRQRVRDRVLSEFRGRRDEFAVEALATLGPDLNEPAAGVLRELADAGGYDLAPAVEQAAAAVSLSMTQPRLLVELAEAFYIQQPRDEWGFAGLDDGVRRHRWAGLMSPMAGWYYGPFYRLLWAVPGEAIALINRILNHAALVRVGARGEQSDDAEPPPGLDLDLPGQGVVRCAGDGHTWAWYRGSSVGPYPCMSALLATERFADELLTQTKLPIDRVARMLFGGCRNLAMPGLVVGLYMRHEALEQLDYWLSLPDLWDLEISRAASEGTLHVQGRDAEDCVGREWRGYSFREAAMLMTVRARLASDAGRLDELREIGVKLVANTVARNDGALEGHELGVLEGRAALFDPQHYRTVTTDDGAVGLQFEMPEAAAGRLAASNEDLRRGGEAWRLLSYAHSANRDGPLDSLTQDLRIAQELGDDPPASGPTDLADPLAAVAAAAVVAHASGSVEVRPGDLRWAVGFLCAVSTKMPADADFDGSFFETGADRSAALALPVSLLLPRDRLSISRGELRSAILRCGRSPLDEVREHFSRGLAWLWERPCDIDPRSGECAHSVGWAGVLEGLGNCRLGEWDTRRQRRSVAALVPPYEDTLAAVEAEALVTNRLAGPVASAIEAALSNCCVAGEARRLVPVLLSAQRRGWDHWAANNYGGHHDHWYLRVVRGLVQLAAAGDPQPLREHIRAFSGNALGIVQLFRGLSRVLTTDAELRHSMPRVWPYALETALDAIEGGAAFVGQRYWSDDAVAELLPRPQPGVTDDFGAVMQEAQQNWIPPSELEHLLPRWCSFARGNPKALDALMGFTQTASAAWQTSSGITLVESFIDGEYGRFAEKCFLLQGWLEGVRALETLDAAGLAAWRRLVDGFSAEGDHRAADLQALEE